MNYSIVDVLSHKISTDRFDIGLAQGVCFLGAVLLLVLSLWKLTKLELNEAELFFGLLLSACLPALFVIMGLLVPLAAKRPTSRSYLL